MAAQLPLIGIAVSPPEDGSPYYNLNPEYSEAIRRAGGAPLAFALIPDDDYVERIMPLVHGLLLTGSQYDLDPAWYGARPESGTLDPNYDRDNFDRLILDWAGEHSLPVLGICHGCQAINVALGGTLVQDIPAGAPSALNHRTPSHHGESPHELEPAPPPLLRTVGGPAGPRVRLTVERCRRPRRGVRAPREPSCMANSANNMGKRCSRISTGGIFEMPMVEQPLEMPSPSALPP